MGSYDDIAPDALRADLVRFAELIRHLDEEGELLSATPRLIKMMGDLRQKLFAYEVRSTKRLEPPEQEYEEVREESERIVREAREREEEAREEWEDDGSPDPEDEDDDG